METLRQDLSYGIRMLLKKPGFTAVAVIALALGIGANSAIFSVVNTVLLRPLPYKDPDQLVMVWEDNTKRGFPRDTPAPANYVDWRDQNQVFESLTATANQSFNLTGVGEPEKIEGLRVSTSLFQMLGVEPALGRSFLPEEDRPEGKYVTIISYSLWQRRFGGDKDLIGKPLTLNGSSYTVVGILPQSFRYPDRNYDLFVPIAFGSNEASRRGSHYLFVIGRIKPGINQKQAQAEMDTIAARLQQQYPETNTNIGIKIIPLYEHLVGDIRPALLVLLGAVGFVLLIACANVANLLLVRAAARQKETAIRTALGAGRLRLIRQFMTESILLAGLGGVAGLLLALWGMSLLSTFIPENLVQARELKVDSKVLGFTFFVSILTGLIFGLAPALQASRTNLNDALKEGGKGSADGGRSRIRNILVISEVALALVLLIGAGLMINSFMRLSSVDVGFRPDNLLTMSVPLPRSKYPDIGKRATFYNQLLQRVESLPGVQSAGVISWLPLTFPGGSNGFTIEGRPEPAPDQSPIAVTRVISKNYFRTMGIEVVKGRQFTEQDTESSPQVVIINEAMARSFWSGEDVMGRRIKFGRVISEAPWISVVGVVKDVRQFGLDAESKPEMYLPFTQIGFFEPRDLVVHTSSDPLSLASAVRNEVWAIDKDQPVSNIRTMEQILSESISQWRFNMFLFGIFAAVALVLAVVGIYGIISYSVTQRTHEIGIRIALGAQQSDVLKMVVGQGLKLISIGVAIGLSAAIVLTRLMSSLLYGVSTTDPATFAIISTLIFVVALLASLIPARRATKVDPMIALRYE
jgi:putative ABC transport system permease protein